MTALSTPFVMCRTYATPTAMQNSQRPRRLVKPFGAAAGSGFIRQVPIAAQPNGAASYDQGFPPETFQPVGSGGVPPSGQDVNGVLFDATGNAMAYAAGMPAMYDAGFAAAIGGYPRFAVLAASGTPGRLWQSTVDNNTSNPDSGGANWALVGESVTSASYGNNGYRVSSDGFKECWGVITTVPNGYATVNLPIAHNSFCNPSGSGTLRDAGKSNDTGVSDVIGSPPTGFRVFSSADSPTTFYWNTRGV